MKVEFVTIKHNTLYTYFTYFRDPFHIDKSPYREYEQPKSNKTKGFSSKAKRRFKQEIENYFSILNAICVVENRTMNELSNLYNFVTLTLSSTQIHDDYYIKRTMLNPFILQLKRKFKVTSYLYVCEAQENGNIHFHFIVNRYIPHKELRATWNKIQDKQGYIQAFFNKHNHRNPNSTDIHKFKKIKHISAYLIKYFTKTENRRNIAGRQSGCSDNIRLIQPFTKQIDIDMNDLLNDYCITSNQDIYSTDYFSYFKNFDLSDIKSINTDAYNTIIQHYYKQRDLIL